MTFRSNFLITIVTRAFWFAAQLTLFEVIYQNVNSINGWSREEYFAFMATGMLINSFVEAVFMPNCANFSELIRTGNLDFVLLKPIDAQFLISFEKLNLAMLNQVLLASLLLGYSLIQIGKPLHFTSVLLYVLYIVVAIIFFYSLMISLASTSIWFGRNQGLYDFWFYITVFARYPQAIYTGSVTADILRFTFSYILPILLVVTVPARVLLEKALTPGWLTLIVPVAAIICLFLSRRIFQTALLSYRSASS